MALENRKNATSFLSANGWLPLFLFLLGAFCTWVLCLPLLPSQDGPNHLYDALIFGRLLTKSSAIYAHYYYVRSLFTPYSVQYYLLLLLMKLASPLLADKLAVSFIVIIFSCGFRYLATGMGESGGVVSLLIFAIVLNWPLAMGFENYCLAMGISLWCLGLWVRFAGRQAHFHRVLFVLLSLIAALTHPLALPVLVGFCGLDLALRVLVSFRRASDYAAPRTRYLPDLVTLLCSSCFIFYVATFIDTHATGPIAHIPYTATWTLRTYLAMYGVAFFGKHGLDAILYRFLIASVLIGGIAMGIRAVRQRSQQKQWGAPESFLAVAIFALVVFPFLPKTINDPYYLFVRLLFVIWIGALAAASAHRPFAFRTQAMLALAAICISGAILAIAIHRINPIAARLSIVQHEPLLPPGSVGISLPGYDGSDYTYPVLYSLPFEWGSSHFFRASNAIMLNAPWMDSTYFPIGPTSALLTRDVNFAILQQPVEFRKLLMADKHLQDIVFPRINFIFFSDPEHIATDTDLNEILQLDQVDHWQCHRNDWYVLCQKAGRA